MDGLDISRRPLRCRPIYLQKKIWEIARSSGTLRNICNEPCFGPVEDTRAMPRSLLANRLEKKAAVVYKSLNSTDARRDHSGGGYSLQQLTRGLHVCDRRPICTPIVLLLSDLRAIKPDGNRQTYGTIIHGFCHPPIPPAQ